MNHTPTPAHRSAPVGYLGSFIVLGLSLSLLGPALSVLRRDTGSTVSGISALFVAQGLGYLVGSVVAGRVYDARGGNRALAAGCVLAAVASLCIPATSSLVLLSMVMAFIGVAAGVIDVGGNTLMVWQFGSEGGSWMSALHFCFGVGALMTPLVVAWSVGTRADLWIAAGVIALVGLGVAGYLVRLDSPAHPNDEPNGPGPAPGRAILVALSVFFVIYVGMELGFAGWIHSWAEDVRLDGVGPAALTSSFWAAFTVGRLAGIVVARRFSPGTVLVASSVVSVSAAWMLVIAGGTSLGAWAGTVLFGLGLAPQFPTMISFAETRIRLTGVATSWFVGAAAAGSLVLPWLIGQLFARLGSSALPVVVAVSATLCAGWVVGLTRLTRRRST